MKLLKRKTDYVLVVKYACVLLGMLLFSAVEKDNSLYSVSVLAAALDLGASVVFTPLLFIVSLLICGKTGLLAAAAFPAVILPIISCIYRKFKVPQKFETAAYVAATFLGFIFLGDLSVEISLEKRLFTAVFTVFLTIILKTALSAAVNKGLRVKYGYEEFASTAVIASVIGLGVCNALSPEVWKAVSVCAILFSAYFFRTGACALFSALAGVSLSLFYGNVNYVSAFLILGLTAESLMPFSRYLSACAVAVVDYGINYIFSVYPVYGIVQFVCAAAGAFFFCVVPTKPLNAIKEKINFFREKQLVRQTVNRNRVMTSNRLYELSNVFTEMKESFVSFRKHGVSDGQIKAAIESETVSAVCLNCDNKERCKEKKNPKKSDMEKIIDIGFAKGKISLVDLPTAVLNTCVHPNGIIFSVNKLLANYREKRLYEQNYLSGRELIASEAEGVSEILRNLALETGELLKYHNQTERALAENLFKSGFKVSEILIYGESGGVSAGLIVDMKEFSLSTLQRVISKTLGMAVSLTDKMDITESKCYLLFRQAPEFDAVFGVSGAKKDGSATCGDSHSTVRIREDKFLIAVSDGMGSGERAESVSSASLSLIESFYKAGLNGNLILKTVNKLLAINAEDDFTALDVAVIDLKNCSADFIKYGSPYGFIIGKTDVRIVEGNALPLGILEELAPAVTSAPLNDGDIILLLSDGISDAFGSSGEIVDYLKAAPAFNPQTLADDILKSAIERNGGVKKDDMTALAARIYRPECV